MNYLQNNTKNSNATQANPEIKLQLDINPATVQVAFAWQTMMVHPTGIAGPYPKTSAQPTGVPYNRR